MAYAKEIVYPKKLMNFLMAYTKIYFMKKPLITQRLSSKLLLSG
jgi:hypothetical protein